MARLWVGFLLGLGLLPAMAQNTYRVQAGDTLLEIARQHNLALAQVLNVNRQVRNPNRIEVGEVLQLPKTTKIATTQTQTPVAAKFQQANRTVPPNLVGAGTRGGNLLSLNVLDRGLPSNRDGAAARGCDRDYEPALTLLVPQKEVGLTTLERPTFYWVSPKMHWKNIPLELTPKLEFTLTRLNEQQKNELLVYRRVFNNSGMPELTSLTLPSDAPPLEVNRRYRWTVTVRCGSISPMDVTVMGLIQRVSAEMIPNTASPVEQAKAGLWYEALQTPDWPQVLALEGLDSFAQYPRQCLVGTEETTKLCSP